MSELREKVVDHYCWLLEKIITRRNGICYHSDMEQVSLQGRWPSIIHRWEVVRMKYELKDLMAFGMFIIALLTFIFVNCK